MEDMSINMQLYLDAMEIIDDRIYTISESDELSIRDFCWHAGIFCEEQNVKKVYLSYNKEFDSIYITIVSEEYSINKESAFWDICKLSNGAGVVYDNNDRDVTINKQLYKIENPDVKLIFFKKINSEG